jgi:hypothetical protein
MQKKTIIKNIKRIINEYGSFTVADVEYESSPVIASFGKDTHVLAERFDSSVTGVTYVHETEVDENEYEYDELPKDVLEEILSIAENYETDQQKTLKRISN